MLRWIMSKIKKSRPKRITTWEINVTDLGFYKDEKLKFSVAQKFDVIRSNTWYFETYDEALAFVEEHKYLPEVLEYEESEE